MEVGNGGSESARKLRAMKQLRSARAGIAEQKRERERQKGGQMDSPPPLALYSSPGVTTMTTSTREIGGAYTTSATAQASSSTHHASATRGFYSALSGSARLLLREAAADAERVQEEEEREEWEESGRRPPSVAEVNAHASSLYAAVTAGDAAAESIDVGGFNALPPYDPIAFSEAGNEGRRRREAFQETVLGECAYLIEQLCCEADQLSRSIGEEEASASRAVDASRHGASLMMGQRELLTNLLCEQQVKEKSLHDIAVVAEDILKGSSAAGLRDVLFVEDEDERSLALVNSLTQLFERRNAEIESLRTSLESENKENAQLLEHLERKERVKEYNLEREATAAAAAAAAAVLRPSSNGTSPEHLMNGSSMEAVPADAVPAETKIGEQKES